MFIYRQWVSFCLSCHKIIWLFLLLLLSKSHTGCNIISLFVQIWALVQAAHGRPLHSAKTEINQNLLCLYTGGTPVTQPGQWHFWTGILDANVRALEFSLADPFSSCHSTGSAVFKWHYICHAPTFWSWWHKGWQNGRVCNCDRKWHWQRDISRHTATTKTVVAHLDNFVRTLLTKIYV